MSGEEAFPRKLTEVELKVLNWVLPEERPGYKAYRDFLPLWEVVASSRWSDGSYILAPEGTIPDLDDSPEPIVALGSIGAAAGALTVIVRRRLGSRFEFEIGGSGQELTVDEFEHSRRWRLSAWIPSEKCPACGGSPREIAMRTEKGRTYTLAVCAEDKRLWVYDEISGMNIPFPVTGFYNELMLQRRIQDPLIALHAGRLFSDLSRYTDSALIGAFATYDRNKGRIIPDDQIVVPAEVATSKLRQLIGKMLRRGNG